MDFDRLAFDDDTFYVTLDKIAVIRWHRILTIGLGSKTLAQHPDTSPSEAEALLREAVDAAVACGAHGVAEQACAGLRGLGVTTPEVPGRSSGPSATTQRVAALAARGMDVPEIAQGRRSVTFLHTVRRVVARRVRRARRRSYPSP